METEDHPASIFQTWLDRKSRFGRSAGGIGQGRHNKGARQAKNADAKRKKARKTAAKSRAINR